VEPCVMCTGAIVWGRVGRLVYGTADPKSGAVESLYRVLSDTRLNHATDVVAGVLEEECREVLRRFFGDRRSRGSAKSDPPTGVGRD
jgi:tRNA(adenine34) deaminase